MIPDLMQSSPIWLGTLAAVCWVAAIVSLRRAWVLAERAESSEASNSGEGQ